MKKAIFIKSVGNISQLTENYPNEIAVVGKSNVGKSSFINLLCNNSKLAKTGKEPGKTRLINYFSIDDNKYYLVDLPGYGYAKVSDAEKANWATLIETYFQRSTGLKHVFMLIDIRRDPTEDDMQMVNYLYFYRVPFTIVATKSDKASRSEIAKRKKSIAVGFGVGIDNVYICSALAKTGQKEIEQRINTILDV